MGELLGFKERFIRARGYVPRTFKNEFESGKQAIMAATGKIDKKIIATIDLENKDKPRNFCLCVAPNDFVEVKAGMAKIDIVFTIIDDQDRLVLKLFNNGRYEGEHRIALGETERLFPVTLTDFCSFIVMAKRLPFFLADGPKIANVEVWAQEQ